MPMKLPSLPVASLLLAAFAAACLGAALIGQYGFNLHPCHLCLLQRIPFAFIIGFGLLGYMFKGRAMRAVVLSALAFFINAGIAIYHSGVERKWWAGLSGCSAPDLSGSIEDLMARIQSAAIVKCDEIQWELFGLSMANYNALICAAAGVAVTYYAWKKWPKSARQN